MYKRQVKFLIENYGQDQMNSLLIALRDGSTIDEALIQVYSFDVDGLESAWREAIGAAPQAASAQPTARYTPTFVPTYVPFAVAPVVVTPTPYVIPTSSSAQPTQGPGGPPVGLTIMLGAACLILVLLIGVLGLAAYLASQKRKGGGNE